MVDKSSSYPNGGQDKVLSGGTLPGMDSVAERLRWILEQRGLSARALSKKAGLADGHVGLILRGTVGDGVAAATLNKLAAAAGVNSQWLSQGIGEPELEHSVHDENATPAIVAVAAEPGEMPETLGQRRDYEKQARSARKQLAQEGASVEEWVWPHVAAANNFTLANSPPSVAMLVALAKVIQAHGDPSVKPKK